jgi:ribulose-5-phosphate 4-epimerase/fuculose-1-phosphate aldolase
MNDLEQKQQLVQACQILNEFGIFDEQGHLSARTEPGADEVYINEFTSPATASIQEFVKFDLNDDEYPESAPAETTIHGQIFRNRDDVNVICHNHSPYAIAVASVGLEMRPVHHVGAVQVDPVRVYEDYDVEGGMLITTDEEGQDIADALGDDRALMLRGHGAILVGETVTEAVMASLKLEYNSRMLYRQAQIGEPWYLPQEQLEASEEFMYTPAGLEKSIDYYLTETLK